VFGRRQDPAGAYAAVIPRWFQCLLDGKSCNIFGDGETSRDFTPVSNVVQANVLAATTAANATGEAFNVACGERLTLLQLHDAIAAVLLRRGAIPTVPSPAWQPFRPGDVRHSLADISKATETLGYEPGCTLAAGLEEAAEWYVEHCGVGPRRRAA
jgi:UDP-N-acetylglucosamine 4-epimerase